MIIHNIPLVGAVLVDAEPFFDHRGVFSRFFCSRELALVMGNRQIVNVNFSRTSRIGTIRGMHYQHLPHQEMKLVRCIRGAVYDVIVDIRKDSPTFLRWHAETLSANNMKMLVVPEGFAHGFQTIEEDSELLYLSTEFYESGAECGLCYSDPVLGIQWPLAVGDISEKDASHPMLDSCPELLG